MDSETDALEVENEVVEETSLSDWASLLASQHPEYDNLKPKYESSITSNAAEPESDLGLAYPDDRSSSTEPAAQQSAV